MSVSYYGKCDFLFILYIDRTGVENTSVRSHSPDIAEALNQEMSATQVRL